MTTEPGAPVITLAFPPARPERPSPRNQTPSAQGRDAASVSRAVRGTSIPNPSSTWMVANGTSHATGCAATSGDREGDAEYDAAA